MMNKIIACVFISALFILSCNSPSGKKGFISNWNSQESRTWIGPDYWTNPLQDWQVEKGRLSCTIAGANRSIHLLTHMLENVPGKFETSTVIGLPVITSETVADGWAGFILGARGEFNDYRDAAVYGKGMNAGVTASGNIFIGKIPKENSPDSENIMKELNSEKGITLSLSAEVYDIDNYTLTLIASRTGTKKVLGEISAKVPASYLIGNIALQSHFNNSQEGINWKPGFWFEKWKVVR